MKPHGAILEFTCQRNSELMRAYRYQIAHARLIDMFEIASLAVQMPASRFWVSEERATIVVSALLAGKPLPPNMRPTKKEMFIEIFNRVKLLLLDNPNSCISHLVAKVINSPAPKFYMLPRSAIDIIYKVKNGYYERIYADNPIYHSKDY